jgi:CheY-like chemotaxis protein
MLSKILVIEDNDQNLYLVTFILEKHGYNVIQAQDGQSGIDAAKYHKPDLILLDIQLPIMDGYAVVQTLKSTPTLMDIPIVAITSYVMSGDRKRALAVGCSGYIEKPINPDTFIIEIEQHIPKQSREMDHEKSINR